MEIESRLTSWHLAELGRLQKLSATREGKALADNLLEIFVPDVNSRCGTELGLACRPDEIERKLAAPDYCYLDERSGNRLFFEVKRLLSESQQQRERQGQQFLRDLTQTLPAQFTGSFGVVFGSSWRPPKPGPERDPLLADLAKLLTEGVNALPPIGDDRLPLIRLAELVLLLREAATRPWVQSQTVDLSSLMPSSCRAFRYREAGTPSLSELRWGKPKAMGGKGYREFLARANCKLASYAQAGYETFLLLDCRVGHDLGLVPLTDLRDWHEEAVADAQHGVPYGPLTCEDFSHIDHVVAFDLSDSGVGAYAWHSAQARLALPLEWSIQPPGWRND